MIERLVKGFRSPIAVADIPVDTRIGIGLKFSGGPGASPAEDLRAAGSAAAESRSGNLGWAWYDRARDEVHRRAFHLLSDLKTALESEGQLELHYQPKITLASGVCDGAEALLRWTHPTFGPVSPAEFIPLAETTALATPVTRWVIDAATRQIVLWRRAGLDMRIAINISPKNLEEPDFVEYLLFVCSVREIPHDQLELEVTEGIEAAQGSLILDRIAALRELGFGIAIDDFGSGYSNMAYLTRLSAKTLKIDRSLVRGTEPGQRSGQLVAGVVRMAHDLGYSIVAEGIETQSELEALSALGCDLGQGWLFGKPMPADVFAEWQRSRSETRRAAS
jgi:EAL domain-containing protein (putative c-di-GMP-specific phosphodiesterase class I)